MQRRHGAREAAVGAVLLLMVWLLPASSAGAQQGAVSFVRAPADGALIEGRIDVEVQATGSPLEALTLGVRWKGPGKGLDQTKTERFGGSPTVGAALTMDWESRSDSNGPYEIKVSAVFGTSTESVTRIVRVNNAPPPPQSPGVRLEADVPFVTLDCGDPPRQDFVAHVIERSDGTSPFSEIHRTAGRTFKDGSAPQLVELRYRRRELRRGADANVFTSNPSNPTSPIVISPGGPPPLGSPMACARVEVSVTFKSRKVAPDVTTTVSGGAASTTTAATVVGSPTSSVAPTLGSDLGSTTTVRNPVAITPGNDSSSSPLPFLAAVALGLVTIGGALGIWIWKRR